MGQCGQVFFLMIFVVFALLSVHVSRMREFYHGMLVRWLVGQFVSSSELGLVTFSQFSKKPCPHKIVTKNICLTPIQVTVTVTELMGEEGLGRSWAVQPPPELANR